MDSSKNPARAFSLSRIKGVDLFAVHLTRDGRGVAASLNRSWRKNEEPGVTRDVVGRPVWKTAAAWTRVNLAAELVRRKLPADRSTRVRQEDLAARPREMLGEIGRLIHVEFSPVAEALAQGGTVEANHNIAGNRLRMSKDVALRAEAGSWEDRLTEDQKRIAWTLMGWLLRCYRYKK